MEILLCIEVNMDKCKLFYEDDLFLFERSLNIFLVYINHLLNF
jgi:hypothetical protein